MSFDKTRSEERRRGNRRAITTANAPSTLPRPPPLIPPPPHTPTLPSQIHLGHNLAADIDTLARVGVTLPRNYKTQAKTPPSDPPPVPKCVFRLRFDSEIQLRVGMEAKPLLLSLPPPPPPPPSSNNGTPILLQTYEKDLHRHRDHFPLRRLCPRRADGPDRTRKGR